MTNIEKMFDEISSRYDFLNNLISLFMHKKIKKIAISELSIKKGDRILDLCAGTGDIAGYIKRKYPNVNVVGLDISSKMIEIAKKRYPEIEFVKGNAACLPFPDNEFDFIISAFGYRNIQDKNNAILEIRRVLKNEGCFLQLDFGKSILTPIFDFLILFFAKIFSKNLEAYKYLIKSKNEFLSPVEIVSEFKKAGFRTVKIKNLLFNIISYQILFKSI